MSLEIPDFNGLLSYNSERTRDLYSRRQGGEIVSKDEFDRIHRERAIFLTGLFDLRIADPLSPQVRDLDVRIVMHVGEQLHNGSKNTIHVKLSNGLVVQSTLESLRETSEKYAISDLLHWIPPYLTIEDTSRNYVFRTLGEIINLKTKIAQAKAEGKNKADLEKEKTKLGVRLFDMLARDELPEGIDIEMFDLRTENGGIKLLVFDDDRQVGNVTIIVRHDKGLNRKIDRFIKEFDAEKEKEIEAAN